MADNELLPLKAEIERLRALLLLSIQRQDAMLDALDNEAQATSRLVVALAARTGEEREEALGEAVDHLNEVLFNVREAALISRELPSHE